MRLLGVIITATIMAITPTSPAQALTCIGGVCEGGNVTHYSPDDGYDPPIIIRCDYQSGGVGHLVFEGERSQKYCGTDTDEIYVRSGEELWCWRNTQGGWYLHFDATGWHKIDDFWTRQCVLQVD